MIKNFTLGAVEWTVEETENKILNKDDLGACSLYDAKIEIQKAANFQIKEETLYHELMHAILSSSGFYEESSNEQLVQTLAQGIYQFEKTKK